MITTDQGLVLPDSTDNRNVPLSFSDFATTVESRLVKRYASVADRALRNPSPTEGELSYLIDSDRYEKYTGSAWSANLLPDLPIGIMADPTTTASNGSSSTGAETRDALLGDYVFTSAGTSRRYRVTLAGMKISAGAVPNLATVTIRDGGASTPTTGSTLLATASRTITSAGGPGQESLHVSKTFTAAAGTRTLSMFTSTTGSTVNPVGDRELYVEDIGLA